MEGVKRLRGAGVGIGLRHPPQTQGVPPGIAGVSVLQLLLPGRFLQVQHTVSGRNAYAGLPQILRQQRPEKNQGPGPVGQGVEHLQGDAVPVIVKPHQPAVVLPEAHWLAGIGHVGLQKGARGGIGFQIVPEQSPADADGEAGKTGQHPVNGVLQGGGPHRLCHQGGEAVDGGILLPLQGGIENTGIVQPVPLTVRFCHPRHLPENSYRSL